MENPQKISAEIPLIEMVDAAIFPMQAGGGTEVEKINWRVTPENFWVVAGLYGSGRSDLLATAAGLQRPARGLVKLFGQETFTLKEEMLVEHRRRIGLVFSAGGRLFNRLTTAENIALPIRYHQNWTEAEAEESVRTIMELTELTSLAPRIPSALSPNWQQRAALARALVLKPEILLLDKPLSGLDFRHRRWTLDFLSKLSEGSPYYGGKKITIVATTDNLQAWRTVGNQFALLKENRWKELGGRAELEANGEAVREEAWADDI